MEPLNLVPLYTFIWLFKIAGSANKFIFCDKTIIYRLYPGNIFIDYIQITYLENWQMSSYLWNISLYLIKYQTDTDTDYLIITNFIWYSAQISKKYDLINFWPNIQTNTPIIFSWYQSDNDKIVIVMEIWSNFKICLKTRLQTYWGELSYINVP